MDMRKIACATIIAAASISAVAASAHEHEAPAPSPSAAVAALPAVATFVGASIFSFFALFMN
ncbi:hypothetical protein C2S52_004196 [Perilla frutescens var. hirtella]|uniref:Arabinogalactan peptide 23-like n=1 Tax=Perilla frutescens var. hirtella TaxID=608512 RepID=A0AAD4J4R9_PERFH|nr:hypothetical protein C2S51_011364 [Perilla frutescens var. frutescens]KAH6793719.1 hypothetical protein C2S52_004196 [Perilla frutescens var. hirtella]KAH6826939.1 hypothetical protein C2S53_013284 [Perilla frutescens var. hirtella]